MRFDPADLARYRDRDWARIRAAKERFWAEHADVEAGLRASEQLWSHARLVDPSWPSPEHRRADLEHHVRLAALMARVAHVFTDR